MPSISQRANAAPKRETYVPRHKQLLLNPALAQQRSLHVDHAEDQAPNPGAAGPRPPIKKLAIGQPILSFSSNPDVKLPETTTTVVKPLKRGGVDTSPVSASGSEAAAHVAESSQVTSTQASRRTSVVQVKRKAVPVYDVSEFSVSNSTSTLSLSITAVSAAPRRHINDAKSANLTGALDQRAVSAAPPSPMTRRTSRDNHGLGLDWASSRLPTDPESMPRTRASSTSSSSQRHSLKNSSPPLLPFPTATSTSTPQRSSIYSQSHHQTVGSYESAAKHITRAASAGPAMDFVLGPDAYAHEDSPDARLQTWRQGMHDVEAERARTQSKRNSESQKHSTLSFFSFRRPSASSGSRASSSAGLSSSSHDTPSTNASSPVDSLFPALPFKDDSGLYRRSSVASSASSSRPFALVSSRSGSVASSREGGVGVAPGRASLTFGADDTRRKSTIASKTRSTGVVGGEDSLLDVWVEMMGGEVEEASEELAQLPFPSRKRSSVAAASDVFGRPPVPSREASVVSQEPTYGAEAIMTLYHALPPLVYASSGRHGSQSESSSAPTLSSDDGLDSESDVSEDWRSACSQPATCEPTLADNHADLTGTWPTAKVSSRARFDMPEHLSPHSPHLSFAPETAHATPTLPSTKSSFLSNASYHISRSSSQHDFSANSRQSLAFESSHHHPTVYRSANPLTTSSPRSQQYQQCPFIAVA
ncbi:BZ3500_MvSof-1268-A1-R1_Chr11-1g03216 [Microbotryum saponariae]|uniref:BZ3500_MvSof-1268-A1-R1_Chr11-1g03216 protein n=1 Tax=Microbotryum saponariae TaxID=289078 RepID=A0A2X0LDJ8_9BASI|nr:BZ3501_MvSof-1269-A2-R1_Chr11g02791 [Microbotryum saponariae]SDA03776.1 BZ3500_MvSof-1268-A1-R1_Chr11-1g03216 [Microbotryum saponariae]